MFEESKEKDSIILLNRDADEVKMGPASAWVVELPVGARRGVSIREGSEVRLLNRDANMHLALILPEGAGASSSRGRKKGHHHNHHHHHRRRGRNSDYFFLSLLPASTTDSSKVEGSLFRISSWRGHKQRSVVVNQGERAASDDLREEIRMDKPVVLTHVVTGAVLEPLSLAKMETFSVVPGQGKPMRPAVLQNVRQGKNGKTVSCCGGQERKKGGEREKLDMNGSPHPICSLDS